MALREFDASSNTPCLSRFFVANGAPQNDQAYCRVKRRRTPSTSTSRSLTRRQTTHPKYSPSSWRAIPIEEGSAKALSEFDATKNAPCLFRFFVANGAPQNDQAYCRNKRRRTLSSSTSRSLTRRQTN